MKKKFKKSKEKLPCIIFATNDYDLIDQLPDVSEIEQIVEIEKHTYKIILK